MKKQKIANTVFISDITVNSHGRTGCVVTVQMDQFKCFVLCKCETQHRQLGQVVTLAQ